MCELHMHGDRHQPIFPSSVAVPSFAIEGAVELVSIQDWKCISTLEKSIMKSDITKRSLQVKFNLQE